MEVSEEQGKTDGQTLPMNGNAEDSCILVESEITTIELDDTIVESKEDSEEAELEDDRLKTDSVVSAENVPLSETIAVANGDSSSETPVAEDPSEVNVEVNGTTVSYLTC